MTPEILEWLSRIVSPRMVDESLVYEIGSYDVNGSARTPLKGKARKWVGFDYIYGKGVDEIVQGECWAVLTEYAKTHGQADVMVSCEALEHDSDPAATVRGMREALRVGGLFVITTPYQFFPYHPWPRDYFRVGKDWIEDYAFRGYNIVELAEIGTAPLGTIVALAEKT